MNTRDQLKDLRNDFVRYGVYNMDKSYEKDGNQYRESHVRMPDGVMVEIIMCNGEVELMKVVK